MSQEALSEEVTDLLLRHIGSVVHLEALLFFRGHPSEFWDAQSLAKRLYASEKQMLIALTELSNDGFLRPDNGFYRYAPHKDHRPTVDSLADAYTHQLIAITNLIHDKRRNIQAFSDAFKLRKDR